MRFYLGFHPQDVYYKCKQVHVKIIVNLNEFNEDEIMSLSMIYYLIFEESGSDIIVQPST